MSGGTPTIGAAEYRRLMGLDKSAQAVRTGSLPQTQGRSAPGPITGRVRRPRPGRSYDTEKMNKTEAAYAAHLDALLAAGTILAWKYEGHKFKLADRTWYTPDFEVIRADGGIEMHEVKGFWEDDARVKIKVAASQYRWYRFLAVKAAKGGRWEMERFGAGKEMTCE